MDEGRRTDLVNKVQDRASRFRAKVSHYDGILK